VFCPREQTLEYVRKMLGLHIHVILPSVAYFSPSLVPFQGSFSGHLLNEAFSLPQPTSQALHS